MVGETAFDQNGFNNAYQGCFAEVRRFLAKPGKFKPRDFGDTNNRLEKKFMKLYEERTV